MTLDKAKGEGSVLIKAGPYSDSVAFWIAKQYTETLTAVFTDHGTKTLDLTASADDFTLQAPKSVTMNAGQHKSEVLVLKENPWIGFQFVDHKTGKDVGNIQLGLNLPGKGDTDQTYASGVLKIKSLDPGTGEVKKTTHPDVWSAEKVEEI